MRTRLFAAKKAKKMQFLNLRRKTKNALINEETLSTQLKNKLIPTNPCPCGKNFCKNEFDF